MYPLHLTAQILLLYIPPGICCEKDALPKLPLHGRLAEAFAAACMLMHASQCWSNGVCQRL